MMAAVVHEGLPSLDEPMDWRPISKIAGFMPDEPFVKFAGILMASGVAARVEREMLEPIHTVVEFHPWMLKPVGHEQLRSDIIVIARRFAYGNWSASQFLDIIDGMLPSFIDTWVKP